MGLLLEGQICSGKLKLKVKKCNIPKKTYTKLRTKFFTDYFEYIGNLFMPTIIRLFEQVTLISITITQEKMVLSSSSTN